MLSHGDNYDVRKNMVQKKIWYGDYLFNYGQYLTLHTLQIFHCYTTLQSKSIDWVYMIDRVNKWVNIVITVNKWVNIVITQS